MPVLATQNLKDRDIFNTMEFVVEDMNDRSFKVNNEWFEIGEFSESFIPSFCVTVYKYQGADINEPYNVYDVNRMDKKTTLHCFESNNKIRLHTCEQQGVEQQIFQ